MSTLDTYQVVKTLRAAGFSEQQAEAVTQVMRDSQNLDLSNLTTKADLSEAIAKIRTEIADTKVELIKWVVGIGLAQAGFMIALLRFMH